MRKFFQSVMGFIIRISAFVAKEFYSVVSQPRLMAVLILGPFLILLIFGISYQNNYRTLRTIVVIPEDSRIEATVRAFADLPLGGINVIDLTADIPEALSSLKNQRADLVMIIPQDAVKKIEDNQQAEFTFYHQEIDPVEIGYVEFVAERVTEEINRQLLLATVERSKEVAHSYQTEFHQLPEAQDQRTGNQGQLTSNTTGAGDSLTSPAILWLLLRAAGGQMDGLLADHQDSSSARSPNRVNPLTSGEKDLRTIDLQLSRFIEMDSRVLVEPFRRNTRSLSEVNIQPVHFYIPAVLALLLQHIAVSLAGLSIVSERFVGTMELMRAAPVNAFEVLVGKYLSFLILLGVLAAILTALVHWGLGVPLIGKWAFYALAVFLVIMVALGFGFLISNFARSDSQAIQFSMILLLGSIFFSGFFLQLYRLGWPAQTIAWLMPATYGIKMLQDIMLRGIQPETWLFWVLGGLSTFLFVLNWLRLRTLMVQK